MNTTTATADPIIVDLPATHAVAATQTAMDFYDLPLRDLSREQAVRVITAHAGGMLLSRLGTTDDSHALAGDLVRSVLGDTATRTLIVRVPSEPSLRRALSGRASTAREDLIWPVG